MDMAVAIGKWHVGVDLQHDDAGFFDGSHGVVCTQADREVAMRIHGRAQCEDDVCAYGATFDFAWYF